MTLTAFLIPTLLLTCACTASTAFGQDQNVPLACNLKAFTPQERAEWRRLIDEVKLAAVQSQALSDGYVFDIDSKRASITTLAQWIDLERKCCPFFNFQLDLKGSNERLTLSLTGREGVKEFIAEDFRPWFRK